MKKFKSSLLCIILVLLLSSQKGTPTVNAQINSNNRDNYNKIDTLIDRNQYEKAKEICLEMLKKNPSDPVIKTYLGMIYTAQFKYNEAEKVLKEALAKTPNNYIARNALGIIYYQKASSFERDSDKYYESAIVEFETVTRLSPTFYQAYTNAAKVFQDTGKLDQAELYYRKALSIEPNDSDAIEGLGTVYFQKNLIDVAIQKFLKAISINKRNSTAHFHLGEAYMAKGEYDKAITYLQSSLYIFPNSSIVHEMLGKAYEYKGDINSAITEYQKAILIKPKSVQPYLNLANIYENNGEYDLAILELKNAVAKNPEHKEILIKIAELSINNDNVDQGIKYYKTFLDNKDTSIEALKGLSQAYYIKTTEISTTEAISKNDLLSLQSELSKNLQINPDDPEINLALLRLAVITNSKNEAEMYFNKIISMKNIRPLYPLIKGEAYFIMGRFRDSMNEFKLAVNMGDSAEDLLNIGKALLLNKCYSVAKIAFERILVISPNNQNAKKILIKITDLENQANEKFVIAENFYNKEQYLQAQQALKDCIFLNPYFDKAYYFLAKIYEIQKDYLNTITYYQAYLNLAHLKPKEIHKIQRKIHKLSLRTKDKRAFISMICA